MDDPYLSVCIATMDRPVELAEELAPLLRQIHGHPIEIVVVDSSSSPADAPWRHHDQVRIIRQEPSGVDNAFDAAVRNARGTYCWLLSDDDRIREGAIDAITHELASEPSALLLESVAYDSDFQTRLTDGYLSFHTPTRLEAPVDARKLAPFSQLLTFIGCLVIRRDLWIERARPELFGFEFIHVGVLLVAALPRHVHVIKDPQIEIRYGVASWRERTARIWDVQWPELIDMLVSDAEVRRGYYRGNPRHRALRTLQYRATGVVNARSVWRFNRAWPYQNHGALATAMLIASLPRLPLNLAVSTARAILSPGDLLARTDLRLARRRTTAQARRRLASFRCPLIGSIRTT